MRLIFAFVLGASLTVNVMLLIESAPPLHGADRRGLVVESPERDFSPTLNHEVIETMRTNRILNTIAFAAAMSIGAPLLAAEPSAAVEGAYRSLEADNIKNTAGSGAQGLAVINSATANTQSIMMQNAASNQQAMNQLQAKMVAQNTLTGAVEGATAINKINSSDLPALLAQLVAIATAGKQEERIVVQQVPAAQ